MKYFFRISGVTCSGKTTLAHSLHKHFKSLCGHELKSGLELNRVEMLNQDAYFREIDDPNHQMIEKLGHFNWEILESMDMNRMINDIMEILGQKWCLYNTRSSTVSNTRHENLFRQKFTENNYKQKMYNGEMLLNDEDHCNLKKIVKQNNLLNILIIEGFLIFNHTVIFDMCNIKYHMHVNYEICQARRSKRIYDPPDVPCYFEMVVWPSYEKHLRKFKDREDVVFLNGDVSPEKCFQFVLDSFMDEL